MQVYVQKSTRTTFPRRPSELRCSELSHAVARASDGNAATATVTYAAKPGYGMLWKVGGTADTLDGFDSAGLTANRAPSVSPGTGGMVQGIAFDGSGNLWASLKGATDSVVSYAPAASRWGPTDGFGWPTAERIPFPPTR